MVASGLGAMPAHADEDFPFGFELTMEVAPQPGTKRMPTLEIGDNGEATLGPLVQERQGPVLGGGQYRGVRAGSDGRARLRAGIARRSTMKRSQR